MDDTIEHRKIVSELRKVVESRSARLLMLVGPSQGKVTVLGARQTIGRDDTADIVVPDGGTSRRHAEITRDAFGNYSLVDLGSRNGTRVNGTRIETSTPLAFGDRIQLGLSTVFVFGRHDPLEDKLLQSQRLESMGKMAGEVAHDFNNLLTSMVANVQYLQSLDSLEVPDAHECIDEIGTASARATELTRQLLDFGRKSQGGTRPVDIAAIVGEVVTLCRRTFGSRVKISGLCPTGLYVAGEPVQLHQVLMNLCVNAGDAVGGDGTITLIARLVPVVADQPGLAPGPHVQIVVTDDGEGIPAEVLPRIFEPFFTTKAAGRGTGLGMATAFRIVSGHGGTLDVDSVQGEGTTIRIMLPAIPPPEAKVHPKSAPASFRRLKVLIIDREPLVRRAIERLVRSMGHHPACASDAATLDEAVAVHGRFDAALIDRRARDREALATRLAQSSPALRVLWTFSGQATGLAAPGGASLLRKPLERDQLSRALNDLLVSTPERAKGHEEQD